MNLQTPNEVKLAREVQRLTEENKKLRELALASPPELVKYMLAEKQREISALKAEKEKLKKEARQAVRAAFWRI